jgi:amidase
MSTFILTLVEGETPPGVTRVAVKDLIDMAGLPTTGGSKVLSKEPATDDAECLAGIRKAETEGTVVIVGKTNLHELAFGVSGINPWFGTPANPLDPTRVPGGSSSGSAVAVATGQADVALGTDTGGSVRIPAACCGVVGLKTTRGRIPLGGVYPLGPSLDTVGPMAATVARTGEGMALLEPGFEWRETGPARRIGRFRLPAERWVEGALEAAVARCAAGGAEVVDVDLPGWGVACEAFNVVLMSEAWTVLSDLWKEHREELSPDVAQRLELGSLIDSHEVAAAWEQARAWAAELKAVFETVDVIALPSMADEPPTLEDGAQVGKIRYTGPFNLAGVPALSMPAWTPVGAGAGRPRFPASLQLVGPAGSEERLLATAAVAEEPDRVG